MAKKIEWGNLAQWAAVVVATLGFLKLNGYLEPGKAAEWISTIITGVAIGVIAGLVLMAIKRFLRFLITIKPPNLPPSNLPSMPKTNIVKWIFTLAIMVAVVTIATILSTGTLLDKLPLATATIAQKARADILEDTREDHEKGTLALADSASVRKGIYRDALYKTGKKGYVFPVAGLSGPYVTNYLLREKNRILTEKQRNAIDNCFFADNLLEEKDFYNSLCYVLSDEKVIESLKSDVTTVHLTPYEEIGVVGGYVGELILERPKPRNQAPKSTS